eukprot:TRINITY_DN11147_c0_g1_i1.p1 TRINITY_DN11147_c0_g1~~TRINITY_DN11147_c0_g1_i1.p1  ORF type:complete len:646 (+),score=192.32 TRINITY_DN11147_c0_g1_i1:98-2035(+)
MHRVMKRPGEALRKRATAPGTDQQALLLFAKQFDHVVLLREERLPVMRWFAGQLRAQGYEVSTNVYRAMTSYCAKHGMPDAVLELMKEARAAGVIFDQQTASVTLACLARARRAGDVAGILKYIAPQMGPSDQGIITIAVKRLRLDGDREAALALWREGAGLVAPRRAATQRVMLCDTVAEAFSVCRALQLIPDAALASARAAGIPDALLTGEEGIPAADLHALRPETHDASRKDALLHTFDTVAMQRLRPQQGLRTDGLLWTAVLGVCARHAAVREASWLVDGVLPACGVRPDAQHHGELLRAQARAYTSPCRRAMAEIVRRLADALGCDRKGLGDASLPRIADAVAEAKLLEGRPAALREVVLGFLRGCVDQAGAVPEDLLEVAAAVANGAVANPIGRCRDVVELMQRIYLACGRAAEVAAAPEVCTRHGLDGGFWIASNAFDAGAAMPASEVNGLMLWHLRKCNADAAWRVWEAVQKRQALEPADAVVCYATALQTLAVRCAALRDSDDAASDARPHARSLQAAVTAAHDVYGKGARVASASASNAIEVLVDRLQVRFLEVLVTAGDVAEVRRFAARRLRDPQGEQALFHILRLSFQRDGYARAARRAEAARGHRGPLLHQGPPEADRRRRRGWQGGRTGGA